MRLRASVSWTFSYHGHYDMTMNKKRAEGAKALDECRLEAGATMWVLQ
jgi:hypothetical protein